MKCRYSAGDIVMLHGKKKVLQGATINNVVAEGVEYKMSDCLPLELTDELLLGDFAFVLQDGKFISGAFGGNVELEKIGRGYLFRIETAGFSFRGIVVYAHDLQHIVECSNPFNYAPSTKGSMGKNK